MFAICIESSHQKGMGHFFRALNIIDYLITRKERYIVFINDDQPSCRILKSKKIPFEIVDFTDYEKDWETSLIKKHEVDFWINDRFNTDKRHVQNVKKNNVKLITFDDMGSGALFSDINIAALMKGKRNSLKGTKVLTGLKYLILNREIEKFRRLRMEVKKILVTLGGSDTYGVTFEVIKILKQLNKSATIITGPSFMHLKELNDVLDNRFVIKNSITSLIKEMSKYDLAVTGGGITPFEANASGLPCIIIANESWEIDNAEILNRLGSSVFAGYHENIDNKIFEKIPDLDLKKMSLKGMENIKLNGLENIYKEICS
jgi:spore coat polysaccharide biosynthesis predicted glycosyltransferase SpsG